MIRIKIDMIKNGCYLKMAEMTKKALKNMKASVTAFWLPSIVGHILC